MTSLRSRTGRHLMALFALALAVSSCAYYNTFYLARKYYVKATQGLPYPVEKPDPNSVQDFRKSIGYSRKLIDAYPKDKLVDDAYLLWSKALLGVDDPRQTITLLEDFPERFPKSSLRNEALFYLGVAYRQARKYKNAMASLDTFLVKAPRHRLAPYAYLERVRTLMALERPEEAALAADELMKRFPKSKLRAQAQVARGEARFTQGAYDLAREDFRRLGSESRSDDERLDYLLREADCLEAARHYDQELALLQDALAHQRAPATVDTTGMTRAPVLAPGPEFEPYARLLIRIGSAHLHAGRLDEALGAYQTVLLEYRGTPFAAEAQYRIGYAYETAADDFERARTEYGRVSEQGQTSPFVAQATQRVTNLNRLAQFRTAGGDSAGKRAEAGFVLAELYLFQLDKPERALEEYQKVSREFSGTPTAAKAMNAQAWVLSHRLKQKAQADSLLWVVVHDYPATEAQLAARDYLESEGVRVPEQLIKLPAPEPVRADTLPVLPAPPATPTTLGAPAPGIADSSARLGPRPPIFGPQPGVFTPPGASSPSAAPRDSSRGGTQPAVRDTSRVAPAPRDTSLAPPDSSKGER